MALGPWLEAHRWAEFELGWQGDPKLKTTRLPRLACAAAVPHAAAGLHPLSRGDATTKTAPQPLASLGDNLPQLAGADAVPTHYKMHHRIGKNLCQIRLGSGIAPALFPGDADSCLDRHGSPLLPAEGTD